jgi:uncharacterized protein
MKYLLVLLIVAAVLWWALRRPRVTRRADRPAASTAAFVACAHCGVHLPSGDALNDGARQYCSEAHRLAGPREPGSR